MIKRYSRAFLWIAAWLSNPLPAAEHFWDEIPTSPSTTRPAVVLDDYWNSEFQRVNREVAAAKDCKLVFFGDSITLAWSTGRITGKDVWEKEFAPYHPINMGNSGDITPVMLHRVSRGNLDFPAGQDPKVAVLLCGINNFGVTKSAGGKEQWDLGINCPPQDIANGQRAVAQAFRRKLPHTRIIMMALFPVADRAKWEKCQRVNAIQAAVTRDSDEVAFLNLQDSFLQADGSINKALFTDGLHLSAEGYQTWARGIASKIEEFMKAPPLDPVKIMLIGGTATEGLDSARSYRRYLDGMLRVKGHFIDFIGSRHKHNDDQTEAESYQFDPDHEGHSGKNFAWFAENMPRLLEQNVPDVAVLQPGAADIAQHITAVIASIRAKNPKVKILIATPASTNGKAEAVDMLNKSMLSSAESPVIVTNIGMDPNANDPGAEGARAIAKILAEAISPLMPPKKTSGTH